MWRRLWTFRSSFRCLGWAPATKRIVKNRREDLATYPMPALERSFDRQANLLGRGQGTRIMSRIHEALKKSERERLLRDAKRSEAGSSEEKSSVTPARDPSAPIHSPMPSFGPSVAVSQPGGTDLVLDNCVQCSWNPQSTMLFFNDLEGRAGNEEFRTLRSRLFQMR